MYIFSFTVYLLGNDMKDSSRMYNLKLRVEVFFNTIFCLKTEVKGTVK